MAAPKYIREKAYQLSRALNRVAELSNELEIWYESKTDCYAAQDFYREESLDIPWEFNLESVLAELDKAADGQVQYRGCY